MKKILITLMLLGLTSCGTKDTKVVEKEASKEDKENKETGPARYALLVQDEAALPKCSDEREGQLVYVVEPNTFKSCNANSWVTININGEDGADGEDGQDGVDGVNGATGTFNMSRVWQRPSDGREFYYTGTTQIPSEAEVCATGWEVPPAGELSSAIRQGLATDLVYTLANDFHTSQHSLGYNTLGALAVIHLPTGDWLLSAPGAATEYRIFCIRTE